MLKVTVIEAKIVDFISRLKDCTSIEATEPVTMPTQVKMVTGPTVWLGCLFCALHLQSYPGIESVGKS